MCPDDILQILVTWNRTDLHFVGDIQADNSRLRDRIR